MDLLFDIPVDTQEIKDTNFQDYYPNITRNTNWRYIQPHIKNAIRQYILPLIGSILYDDIAVATDGILYEVKDHLLFAAANYTVFIATPSMNVAKSEGGLFQNSPDNAVTTSQWAFMQMRWNAIYNADQNLDMALKLLVENTDNASVTTWKDSKYYERSSTLLISGHQMWQDLNQSDSFRTYLSMIPYIKKAEDMLMSYICKDQIIQTIEVATPNDSQQNFLDYCRKYIIEKAIYMAIPHLNIYMDRGGLFVVSSVDGMDSRVGVFSKTNIEAVSLLQMQVEAEADRYYQKIKSILYGDPDSFPLWKETGYNDSPNNYPLVTGDCQGGVFL